MPAHRVRSRLEPPPNADPLLAACIPVTPACPRLYTPEVGKLSYIEFCHASLHTPGVHYYQYGVSFIVLLSLAPPRKIPEGARKENTNEEPVRGEGAPNPIMHSRSNIFLGQEPGIGEMKREGMMDDHLLSQTDGSRKRRSHFCVFVCVFCLAHVS